MGLFCACMPAKSNKHPSELPKRNRFGRRRVRGSTERSDAERYDKLPTSTDLSKPAAKAGQPRVPPSYAEAQQLPVVTGRFIEADELDKAKRVTGASTYDHSTKNDDLFR